MISINMKSLLGRLNRYCTSSLEGAAGLCISLSHYEVSIEHLLLRMMDNLQSDIPLILKYFEINPSRIQKGLQNDLEEFRSGNAGKPVFSPILLEWFQDAWLIASIDFSLSEIRSGILFVSLLANKNRYAGESYIDILEKIGEEELRKDLMDIVSVSQEEPVKQGRERGGAIEKGRHGSETALERFTIDFTARASSGEIDPVFGRDREIRQIIDILARRRKNNPIVVGEAGVGKTAVVEGLALKIVDGDIPSVLKDVRILGLDMGLLQAGAGVKGEFENRLKSVINEVKSSPKPVIMFIDEAHTLIGAGGQAGGSDAANLLKPALARGELRTIAATTWSEYKKYFEKDPALARRFQLVKLDEPSEDEAVVILRGLRERYESSHNVYIQDEAVVASARLSNRYLSGRQLPDKAVDLIDTASARVKIGLTAKPDRLQDMERNIQILERELNAYKRDRSNGHTIEEGKIEEIEEEIQVLKEGLTKLEKRWKREKEAVEKVISLRRQEVEGRRQKAEERPEDIEGLKREMDAAIRELEEIQGREPLIYYKVDEDVIAKVVSDWTGIPIGKMVSDEATSILEFDRLLGERIKGQPHAIETISKGIRASKSGMGNPDSPIGVFLLVGPSGVGKTETGLGIADLLFGGERFMVTINMSEFQEKHTVSRLIGSPPGYVGYGEGGVLTEAVRQHPYSVVLLDEVEKADPEVMNLFYQVFDKGMLTDGEGRVIDFKNTIIFMTSNLASDIIEKICHKPDPATPDTVINAIRPILSRHFKPALLARMTIVPFYPINMEAMKDIVELKLKQLARRLDTSHKICLEYEKEVVDAIASRCTEVETGARNIDHIMQGNMLPGISTEILQRMSEGALPDKLKIGIKEGGDFRFEFE